MNTPVGWYLLLLSLCILVPYVLGIAPRRRRDWTMMTATVAFLTWLLGGFAYVR